MKFKIFNLVSFLTLGMVFYAMPDVVSAQVLNSKVQRSPATVKSPAPVARNNTQASKPVTPNVENAPVKKNFSGKEEEPKYNNTSPKIVSFKVVNGEVVLDKNKERSILVYYDNYQVLRGLDEYVRCSLRIYVLNDLTEKISSLGFKLYWPEISTSIQMNQLNPGVRTYKDIMLMGDGCFALDKAPTIEVNRCRVKNMSQDKCADAIKWYEKPKS
jgi:hypothetical protein